MEKITKNYKLIIAIIVVLAVALRIFFVENTDIATYQFDCGMTETLAGENGYEALYTEYDSGNNEGRHIDYIMKLYNNWDLPNKIIGQFYHPPLHHTIMALTLKIFDNFDMDAMHKFEGMQYVTLIYSLVLIYVGYKILEHFEVKDKYKIIPMLLFSFYPLCVFLSGSINNDELVTMFSMLALLYTLKWETMPSMKNAIWLAIWIGLGLMTKTSAVVMLIPAVYVYFKEFKTSTDNTNKVLNLIFQMVIVAVIIAVLGGWFHIKSLSEGLNTIGIIQPYEELSVEKYGLWARFGLTNPLEWQGNNLWSYFLHSSLNFTVVIKNLAFEMIFIVMAIIILVVSLYYLLKNAKENKVLIVTTIIWWLSYIYLNISMPYSCSMHSRYMYIPLAIGFVALGKGLQNSENEKMNFSMTVLTVAFSILSVMKFFVIF